MMIEMMSLMMTMTDAHSRTCLRFARKKSSVMELFLDPTMAVFFFALTLPSSLLFL